MGVGGWLRQLGGGGGCIHYRTISALDPFFSYKWACFDSCHSHFRTLLHLIYLPSYYIVYSQTTPGNEQNLTPSLHSAPLCRHTLKFVQYLLYCNLAVAMDT